MRDRRVGERVNIYYQISNENLLLAHHGEWNVEGCHEEVTQGEVCNEEVGDGVESPGPDDDTEY